jgi:hypothetical protein
MLIKKHKDTSVDTYRVRVVSRDGPDAVVCNVFLGNEKPKMVAANLRLAASSFSVTTKPSMTKGCSLNSNLFSNEKHTTWTFGLVGMYSNPFTDAAGIGK